MRIAFIFFLLMLGRYTSAVATIIILRGTSCAGKSSICSELIKFDSRWKVVDEDAFYYREARQRWARMFPVEYASISRAIAETNILHAVMHNQILFMKTSSEKEQHAAYIALQKIQQALNIRDNAAIASKALWYQHLKSAVISQVHDYALMGHNVIIDSWFLKTEEIEQLEKNFPVIFMVAYAPFDQLVVRLLERNTTAVKNKRFFLHILRSFFLESYDLVPAEPGAQCIPSNAIDILTIESLNNSFKIIETSKEKSTHTAGLENFFTRGEFSSKQLSIFKEKVVAKFQGHQACYVIPKKSYDVLINTSKQSPTNCVKELVAYITDK